MSVGKCKQRSDLQIYKSTNHMYIPLLWPVSVLNSNKHHRQTIYNRSHKLRTERQSKFQGSIAMVFEWMYNIKLELNRTHKESSRNTSEGNENQINHYREQTLKWKGIINRKGLRCSNFRVLRISWCIKGNDQRKMKREIRNRYILEMVVCALHDVVLVYSGTLPSINSIVLDFDYDAPRALACLFAAIYIEMNSHNPLRLMIPFHFNFCSRNDCFDFHSLHLYSRWFFAFPMQFHFDVIHSFKFRLAFRTHFVRSIVCRLTIMFVESWWPILVITEGCICGLLIYIYVNLTAVDICHPTFVVGDINAKTDTRTLKHLRT